MRSRPIIDLLSVAGFLTPLLAGPALGLFAWQSDRVDTTSTLSEVIRSLGNVPSPWLFLAFISGALLVRPVWGGVGGATALALAVATYYVAIRVSGDREGIPLQGAMTGWFAVALIAGLIFGAAGATWRSGPGFARAIAVGLLTGTLVGEVAYFAGDALRYDYWQWGDTRVYLAMADVAVALSLPLFLLRSLAQRLSAYATAVVMGVIALIVMLWLDQLMLELFNA